MDKGAEKDVATKKKEEANKGTRGGIIKSGGRLSTFDIDQKVKDEVNEEHNKWSRFQ